MGVLAHSVDHQTEVYVWIALINIAYNAIQVKTSVPTVRMGITQILVLILAENVIQQVSVCNVDSTELAQNVLLVIEYIKVLALLAVAKKAVQHAVEQNVLLALMDIIQIKTPNLVLNVAMSIHIVQSAMTVNNVCLV